MEPADRSDFNSFQRRHFTRERSNAEQKIPITLADKILEKTEGKNKTDYEETTAKSKPLKMYWLKPRLLLWWKFKHHYLETSGEKNHKSSTENTTFLLERKQMGRFGRSPLEPKIT